MIKHVKTVEEFNEEVKSGNVLVDFYADWCSPCRMLAPVLEEIAEANEHLKVLKVNVDEVRDLAIKYNVASIPTMIVLKDGQIVTTQMGYMPVKSLQRLIDNHVK